MFKGNASQLPATGSALLTSAVLRRKARVFVVALILLTMLGPFGTFEEFNVYQRALYWATILGFSSAIFEIVVPRVLYSPSLMRKISRGVRFLLGVLIGSFFVFWVVLCVEYLASDSISIMLWPWVFMYVATIGTIICYISFIANAAGPTTAGRTYDINYERIAFFDAYPHLKGKRLCWITIEDHYARIVAEDGEIMVHASMRELEQLLNRYPGMRIHRSHWVSHDAIRGIIRNGRSVAIDIGDDKTLPVGGTYRHRVESVISEIATAKVDQKQP